MTFLLFRLFELAQTFDPCINVVQIEYQYGAGFVSAQNLVGNERFHVIAWLQTVA